MPSSSEHARQFGNVNLAVGTQRNHYSSASARPDDGNRRKFFNKSMSDERNMKRRIHGKTLFTLKFHFLGERNQFFNVFCPIS